MTGNLTEAKLETVCEPTKDDVSGTTVAVTLTSVIPADFAVIVSTSLEVTAITTSVSSLTAFERRTLVLVVVSGQSNRSSALRVSVSPGVHRPLAPAASFLALLTAA